MEWNKKTNHNFIMNCLIKLEYTYIHFFQLIKRIKQKILTILCRVLLCCLDNQNIFYLHFDIIDNKVTVTV